MCGLRKIHEFLEYPKMNYANFTYDPRSPGFSGMVPFLCADYANFAEPTVIVGRWREICSVRDQLSSSS